MTCVLFISLFFVVGRERLRRAVEYWWHAQVCRKGCGSGYAVVQAAFVHACLRASRCRVCTQIRSQAVLLLLWHHGRIFRGLTCILYFLRRQVLVFNVVVNVIPSLFLLALCFLSLLCSVVPTVFSSHDSDVRFFSCSFFPTCPFFFFHFFFARPRSSRSFCFSTARHYAR